MTYNIQRDKVGRKAFTRFEMDMPVCRWEYGEQVTNVLLYSEQFDYAPWSNSFINVTADAELSPEGTLTADKIHEDSTTNYHQIFQSTLPVVAGDDYTFSVYVKAAERSALILTHLITYFGGTARAYYDLVNNIAYATYGIANIEYMKNGWRRISYTCKAIATGNSNCYIVLLKTYSTTFGDAYYLGDGSSGLYVWGAQFDTVNYAGGYVKTTTASATNGCQAENAKANLLTYSEQFDHANWISTGTPVITANTDIAPDGTLTADTVEDDDAVTEQERIRQVVTGIDITQNHTASIYVKKDSTPRTTRFVALRLKYEGPAPESNFLYLDTGTGEYSTNTADTDAMAGVESVSDYWRISISAKSQDASNTYASIYFHPAVGASASWVNSATATGSAVIWGAQLVKGSVPGIYYKTEATAWSGNVGTECRNTNNTCKDLLNYSNDYIPKTITICDKDVAIVGTPMHPLLQSAQLSPTKIVKNKALGKRAEIKLMCRDEGTYSLADDADLDPYWKYRNYSPQGTFWRKFKAIFKYYNGAVLRVKTGYIADPYDPDDCVTRHYILDDIQGPSKSGQITLIARDILKLADDKRAKWPVPTTGTLAAAMTISSTVSFTITGGAGQYTDAGAYIRIGDEVIHYTSGSDSGSDYVIAGTITRNAYNTTAKAHELGDSAQLCYELNATNLVDFLELLVFTAAGINSDYKDAGWATEKSTWFTSTNLNGLITKPEGVNALIEELQEHHALFYIWWNEITQKIILKAVSPTTSTAATLNDAENIIEVVDVKEGAADRLTRSYVLFGPHNPIETDKFEDYKTAYVTIDTDAENSAQYGDQRESIAKARFLTSEGLAVQFGARKLARYRDPPKLITLILDAKDTDLWTGDVAKVSTRYMQNVDGSNKETLMQVFSVQEMADKGAGTHYKYELADTVYKGRYGRIMSAASASTYSTASDAEKAIGCYIISATFQEFSDGGLGYSIV